MKDVELDNIKEQYGCPVLSTAASIPKLPT